jgi:hypothetical protein
MFINLQYKDGVLQRQGLSHKASLKSRSFDIPPLESTFSREEIQNWLLRISSVQGFRATFRHTVGRSGHLPNITQGVTQNCLDGQPLKTQFSSGDKG